MTTAPPRPSKRSPVKGTPAKAPKGPLAGIFRRPEPAGPVPSGFVVLAVVVVVLNIIGMVMVLSASSVEALRNYGSAWFFFKRQTMWMAGGSLALLVGMRVDYRRWRRWATPLLLLSALLLIVVLVPGIGKSVYGSRRWLGAGSLRVQPSELAKLAAVLFTADLLVRRSDSIDDPRLTVRPVMFVMGLLAGLIVIEPDMGTALVLVGAMMSVLFVSGAPMGALTKLSLGGVALVLLFARLEPYRWARILSFRDPLADADGIGYQLAQSLVGLGTGGLSGVGLGASRAKQGFLPHSHTDFIFAVIGEEVGLIGTVLVVALFAAFTYLGIRAAVRAPDRFGTLLATGVTAIIATQALINIGAVIGLLPVTGVPLPFISFGGSSLLVTMAATGALLNVARQGRGRTRPRG